VVEGPLGALLSAVMRHIAHYPIRTRGNLLRQPRARRPGGRSGAWWPRRSAPKWLPAVRAGTRIIAAGGFFFQGIMTTALEADELLAEVRLPHSPGRKPRAGFYEFKPPRRRFRHGHGGW